jgi:hypothetical protein
MCHLVFLVFLYLELEEVAAADMAWLAVVVVQCGVTVGQ